MNIHGDGKSGTESNVLFKPKNNQQSKDSSQKSMERASIIFLRLFETKTNMNVHGDGKSRTESNVLFKPKNNQQSKDSSQKLIDRASIIFLCSFEMKTNMDVHGDGKSGTQSNVRCEINRSFHRFLFSIFFFKSSAYNC